MKKLLFLMFCSLMLLVFSCSASDVYRHLNKVYVSAKASTCTESGNKAHWKVEDIFGTYYFDGEYPDVIIRDVFLPALGHQLEKVIPTSSCCTVSEYYTCRRCGKSFLDEGATEEYRVAYLHTVDPTMKYDAQVHYYECTICQEHLLLVDGSYVGGEEKHTSGEKVRCEENEHDIVTCTVCGIARNEDVARESTYDIGFGQISRPELESAPCGVLLINGRAVASGGVSYVDDPIVSVGYLPHLNSNEHYDLYCRYQRNGVVKTLSASDGVFQFEARGDYEHRITLQIVNQGGTVTKTYKVFLSNNTP